MCKSNVETRADLKRKYHSPFRNDQDRRSARSVENSLSQVSFEVVPSVQIPRACPWRKKIYVSEQT